MSALILYTINSVLASLQNDVSSVREASSGKNASKPLKLIRHLHLSFAIHRIVEDRGFE